MSEPLVFVSFTYRLILCQEKWLFEVTAAVLLNCWDTMCAAKIMTYCHCCVSRGPVSITVCFYVCSVIEHPNSETCPVWIFGRNLPLINLLISALYILFACLLGFPHLLPFLLIFLTDLHPYLPFPLRIDPLCFQPWGHKRRPNLGLSCLSLFWVTVFLCSWCMVILRCSKFRYSRCPRFMYISVIVLLVLILFS